jgi:hypothetical protein
MNGFHSVTSFQEFQSLVDEISDPDLAYYFNTQTIDILPLF